ncbi:MAG: tRNA (N6-isopentenyl adenosine(37)-C2)-methylthiotransferase MiaB [Clostridia bacterium]|nr:tRNA (N6-isopentenyl adenosine(37)-C2)-methylthiotransferase MiaB [Clostridia bacterium]
MSYFSGKKYNIVTFGCQMNVHESEKIAGILQDLGLTHIEKPEMADVVVFNTCCIREGAEDRAFSNISALKKCKAQNKDMIIAVCGCMPQQKQGKYDFKKKLPFVDIVIGTHNVNMLGVYLKQVVDTKKRVFEVVETPISLEEGKTTIRDDQINAYVNIIYGCNKFCTYCIVPHVRGRERSRPYKDIEAEVKDLIGKGYRYITLLGQNVNSYGKDLNEGIDFATLLTKLSQIEGEFKLKFMTSHPIDFNKDVIKVMKNQPKVAKCLHLPVQSGNDEVLFKMNRHYNIKHYNKLIKATKRAVKNVALSTDIIVGFPGETEKAFEDTLKLIKKVRYDQIFAFMYSKRTGTPAVLLPNQIDEDVKNKRINKLLREQKFISKQMLNACVGKTYNCLVVVKNGVTMGLTDGGREIYLPNDSNNQVNHFVDIKIEDIRNHKLSGVIIDGRRN